jgi:hypothetical protein
MFSPHHILQQQLTLIKVTSKVFMSNVIIQVVERHLIDNLEDIFDATNVQSMEEEKLQEIFAEDEHTRNDRLKLQAEKTSLEAGLKSARKLAARKDLKVVSPLFSSLGIASSQQRLSWTSPSRHVQQ